MKRSYFLFGLMLCCLSVSGQGLHFRGTDHPIEDRTSLTVNLRRSLTDSLVLRFDLSLTREEDAGYIFRLGRFHDRSDADGICLFMDSMSPDYQFRIIREGHRFVTDLTFPKTEVRNGEWLPVCFKLDPQKDSCYFTIGPHTVAGDLAYESHGKTILCFGKNEYRIDVPGFDLRNLTIMLGQEKVAFPLTEDSGNVAFSTPPRFRARVFNPEWLNQNRLRWKKIHTQSSTRFLTCGYDASRHEAYMISRDSLYRLPVEKGNLSREKTRNSNPLRTFLGSSYSAEEGYYCYEAYYEDVVPPGTPTMALLDRDGCWTVLSEDRFPTQLHHHNLIADTLRHCHWLYGGFGNRLYNGRFYRLDEDHVWQPAPDLSGDEVWPRYFASAGWDPATDKIYLFGGMGNESGDHIVGRQYMYDFFVIDPDTFEARKAWSLPRQWPNKVPVRNMVLPGDRYFYTLMYAESYTETELQLYRFSLGDGEMQPYADAIPMNSDRILTNANLYYDEALQKLVALIEETTDDIDSRVSIYTLSFPPLKQGLSTVARRNIWTGGALFLVFLAAGFIIGLFLRRKLRSRKFRASIPLVAQEPLRPTPSSIFLFGGFAAYDAKGDNITTEFPERIRHLLLLILLGGEKGISSKRIRALLWPDKDDDRAKNLRGVTMNKLRKALSGMEGVSIEYEDGFFILRSRDPFVCDYFLFRNILTEENPDMNMLVRLLSRGKFLLGESDPIFDKMKQDAEQQIQHVMQSEMKRRLGLKEYANAALCADIMFQIDPLDEDALKSKVQAYRRMGREDEARSIYQIFISQYKREYGEDYGCSYENL